MVVKPREHYAYDCVPYVIRDIRRHFCTPPFMTARGVEAVRLRAGDDLVAVSTMSAQNNTCTGTIALLNIETRLKRRSHAHQEILAAAAHLRSIRSHVA